MQLLFVDSLKIWPVFSIMRACTSFWAEHVLSTAGDSCPFEASLYYSCTSLRVYVIYPEYDYDSTKWHTVTGLSIVYAFNDFKMVKKVLAHCATKDEGLRIKSASIVQNMWQVILYTWSLVHHSGCVWLVLLDHTNDHLDHIRRGSIIV